MRGLTVLLFALLPAPAAERRLTLEEALTLALKNNLDIEIERVNIGLSRQALRAARGAYDGVVRWQPGLESRNTPTSSVLFGADGRLTERFHNETLSYLQKLDWQGSSFHLDFDNSRTSTTNPFVGLNPSTTSRLVLGYSMPLFRNRLMDRERAEIRIRSKQIHISEADLEMKVIAVATQTEMAYWDLVASRQDVGVKAGGVEWAREQLGRNRRMIEAGHLAPIEIAASEAELERRLDSYHTAVAAAAEAGNHLKTLILPSRHDDLWNDSIVPAEERAAEPKADGVEPSIAAAVAKRPELRQLTMRRESNEIQKTLALEQTKPQVNLAANYVNSGLAGSAASLSENPFSRSNALTTERLNELSARAGLPPLPAQSFGAAPASLTGGLGSALSGVFGGNYQTIQAGLVLEWNPRNRAAQAAVEQAVLTERRLQLERTRIEQAIAAQVRDALESIGTARQRIAAAEASARAAKEKLESETRLFQAGESTNFFVLTRQNEYTDSLRRALVARLEMNKAVARLHNAMGETLEVRGMRITGRD